MQSTVNTCFIPTQHSPPSYLNQVTQPPFPLSDPTTEGCILAPTAHPTQRQPRHPLSLMLRSIHLFLVLQLRFRVGHRETTLHNHLRVVILYRDSIRPNRVSFDARVLSTTGNPSEPSLGTEFVVGTLLEVKGCRGLRVGLRWVIPTGSSECAMQHPRQAPQNC